MNLRRERASVAVLLLGVSLGVNVAARAAGADTPASQSASDTKDQPKLETVVVTGIRASLGKSLEEKQNAEIVADSINAIELGRFPDDDVADSLRHITGVSITRTTGGDRKSTRLNSSHDQISYAVFCLKKKKKKDKQQR